MPLKRYSRSRARIKRDVNTFAASGAYVAALEGLERPPQRGWKSPGRTPYTSTARRGGSHD